MSREGEEMGEGEGIWRGRCGGVIAILVLFSIPRRMNAHVGRYSNIQIPHFIPQPPTTPTFSTDILPV